MTIKEEDYIQLRKIAIALLHADEEDPDLYDLYEQLNTVINHIIVASL